MTYLAMPAPLRVPAACARGGAQTASMLFQSISHVMQVRQPQCLCKSWKVQVGISLDL